MEKIYRKVTFVLAGSIALVAILLTAWHAWSVYREIIHQEEHEAKKLEESFDRIVEHLIEFYRFRAKANVNSPGVIEAIRTKDHDKLFSLINARWQVLRNENPDLAFMQFHLADGRSLLRVHDPMRYGDNIAAKRPMLQKLHRTKQELHHIEVGVHGVAYRVAYPIFDGGKYIGAVEFGIDPRYFIHQLSHFYGLASTILINKKFIFPDKIGRYYSVNNFVAVGGSAPSDHLDALKKTKLEKLQRISVKEKNYSVHIFNIPSFQGEEAAKIVIFQDMTEELTYLQSLIIISILLMLLIVGGATFLTSRYLHSMIRIIEMARQREERDRLYLRTILDVQPSIIVVTDGYQIIDMNSAFFNFFCIYKTVDEFKRDHGCICDFFIPDPGYLTPVDNGVRWIDRVIKEPTQHHKAKIQDCQGKIHIFEVKAKEAILDGLTRKVATFNDITASEEAKEILKIKATQEEELAIQNSKLAAIGEMVGLIAHQWRQPLNSLGLIIQDIPEAYRYGELDEAYLEEFVNKSLEQINYMNQTIEDFRSFLKGGQEELFSIETVINKTIALLSPLFKQGNISVKLNLNTNSHVRGNPNEFQ
ncbi:MAG: hypothetical protein K6347_04025, partial [Campylobacterales bacterium]